MVVREGVAALAWALLLLAGCLHPSQPSASIAPVQPSCASPCASVIQPDAVDIHEGGLMVVPGSLDHGWKVGAGVRNLTVRLFFEGPASAPAYTHDNVGYRLVGPPNETLYADWPATSYVQSTGPGGCVICIDWHGDDLLEAAGDWHLHAQWQPSAGQFDLRIRTTY